ncbi:hypothetical protein [Trinickia diaoshuihuensis]|uniref:hypothetical protein n=1 Tax=Trinickia diaoshuihuensis TaxID=2292265 RepID=UPI0013C2E0C5|nr:hypothetical protein [Trinickia diaoshuihuensis]
MVTLNKEAFKNVLAETFARAMPEFAQANSALVAAATHQRHKVADHYLQELYDAANEASANSMARKYFIYRLLVEGQAAYRVLGPLVSTRKNALASVQVEPHYAKDIHCDIKFYPGITQEPLNIFAGLSTTNTRGNKRIIDLNTIFVSLENDGVIHTAAFSGSQDSSSLPTRSQHLARATTHLAVQQTTSRADLLATPTKPPARPVLKEVPSPLSAAISITHSPNAQERARQAQNIFPSGAKPKKGALKDKEEAKALVERLLEDAEKLTEAGNVHYMQLIGSYEKMWETYYQGEEDPYEVSKTLEDSRKRWNEFRSELVRGIKGLRSEINRLSK